MGGFDGYSPIETVEKVDLTKLDRFILLPSSNSLLSPLKNACCVSYNNKCYIIGGWD